MIYNTYTRRKLCRYFVVGPAADFVYILLLVPPPSFVNILLLGPPRNLLIFCCWARRGLWRYFVAGPAADLTKWSPAHFIQGVGG